MSKRGLKSGIAMRHEMDAVPHLSGSVYARIQDSEDIREVLESARRRSVFRRILERVRSLRVSPNERGVEPADDDNE